jgi:hypothetical protein
MMKTMKGKLSPSQREGVLRAFFERREPAAKIARDNGVTPQAIRYLVRRHIDAGNDPHNAIETGAQWASSGMASEQPARAAGLDSDVYRRVTGMVAQFLAVLDVAAASSATEELLMLQDASDTLMRAIARVRIEVDRTIARRQGDSTTNSAGSAVLLER